MERPGKNKKCPECGAPLIGRLGKKFCSPRCKSRHHNAKLRAERTGHYREMKRA